METILAHSAAASRSATKSGEEEHENVGSNGTVSSGLISSLGDGLSNAVTLLGRNTRRLLHLDARSVSERLSTSRAKRVSIYDHVPSCPSGITTKWMARALVDADAILRTDELAAVSVQSVAAPGYLSDTVRVSLSYRPGSTGPTSVIVKLPHSSPAQLEEARKNNSYEMEYQFYDQLWSTLEDAQVPMATCLLAASDAKCNLWILVLEDITLRGPTWRGGDQVLGISLDEMAAACVSLARMHAAFWGASSSKLPDWVPSTNEIPLISIERNVEHYWQSWKCSSWPARGKVSAEAMAAAEVVANNARKVAAMLEEPPLTLVHHDARPDNLFFGPGADGSTEAVILDWQLLGRGKGPIDVTRALITNFEPGATGAVERQRELIKIYHAELMRCLPAETASLYSFDMAWRDYRLGAAWMLLQALIVCPASPFSCNEDDPNDRSFQLFCLMNRHAACLADLEVASLLVEK